jgi:hypothetical protein
MLSPLSQRFFTPSRGNGGALASPEERSSSESSSSERSEEEGEGEGEGVFFRGAFVIAPVTTLVRFSLSSPLGFRPHLACALALPALRRCSLIARAWSSSASMRLCDQFPSETWKKLLITAWCLRHSAGEHFAIAASCPASFGSGPPFRQ